MLSLRDLQGCFAAHLFEDEPAAIVPWIRGDGIDPTARLRIYRNNLHEGFQKTLALEYPVIGRLVGSEYFRQLALGFLARHPSTSGNLHHVGAPFASFLRQQFADTAYLYLTDVATLEWSYQECLVAEESEPLDPLTLRERSRAVLWNAAIYTETGVPPGAFTVSGPHHLGGKSAWAPADEIIDLNSGPDFLTVFRNSKGTYFTSHPRG